MTKRSAQDLLERYRAGRCTAEERRLVEAWFAELGADEFPGEGLVNDTQHRARASMALLVRRRRPRWQPLAAAAAICLFMSVGLYSYYRDHREGGDAMTAAETRAKDTILPGGKEAVLILADGSKIKLDDAGSGNLAVQGNTNIIKLANGQIRYHENGQSESGGLNVLQTPRGGQYT